MVRQFEREGANALFFGGGAKYAEYNKINNNSKNFRRKKSLLEGMLCHLLPLSYGPGA